MPINDGTSVGEARQILIDFLKETGCYEICAKCPVYGEDGCCSGCSNLVRGVGCQTPNLSCLSYTCGVLNTHLMLQDSETHKSKLEEFTDLIYGLPREGYRGCQRREESALLEISDPLGIHKTELSAELSLGSLEMEKED